MSKSSSSIHRSPRAWQRTRREFLRDAGIASGAIAGSATGPWLLRNAAAQDKTTISIWSPYPLVPEEGEEIHTYAALTNEFNEQNDHITAEVFTTNWSPEKLVTAVAGGDPPDLFYMDRYLAAEWAARGLIESLDDRIAASAVIKAAEIWPTLTRDVTWDGQMYAVPHYTDVRAFYWNKAVFSEVGLDPETAISSWDELKAAIPQILVTNDRNQIDRLGYAPSIGNPPGFLMWYIHLWQLGGEFMNEEKTQVTFNNEAGIGSFQYMLDTFDLQGGYPSVSEFATSLVPGPGQDIFMLGKLGAEVNGSWMPPNFTRYAPDLTWGFGAIPIPEGGQQANYSGGHAWVIPKGAEHPDEAFEFIEWMLEPANQLRIGLSENQVPALQTVAESDDFINGEGTVSPEQRQLFVEQVSVSQWVPVIPGVGEILASNSRAFDEVMQGVSTPEQAVETMAAECQAILDNWQADIQS